VHTQFNIPSSFIPAQHTQIQYPERTTPGFTPVPVKHKAKTARPRPFATYYYTSIKDDPKNYARIGHACTGDGAVRAGMWKLLKKEAEHVDVYNEDGARVAVLERRKDTIKIIASWL
jgi:hypothetical protein